MTHKIISQSDLIRAAELAERNAKRLKQWRAKMALTLTLLESGRAVAWPIQVQS